jgi:hypothetical protein
MRALLALALMPVIWSGMTHDGVECKLNQDSRGLVASVGKGGKSTKQRVASQSTGLSERSNPDPNPTSKS